MAEFRRKFYDWLMQWKATKHHECLLVKGARQIGKTFIVEKFGREQYESFIEFNFILDPEACAIFDGSLKADDLYRKISAYDATRRLLPGRTLIFLDEIQECANARTALKALAQDAAQVEEPKTALSPEAPKAEKPAAPKADAPKAAAPKAEAPKPAEKTAPERIVISTRGKTLTCSAKAEETQDAETAETTEGTEVDTVTGNEIVDEDGKDGKDEKPEKSTVFYITDEVQQAQYISMFRKNGKDAVILKHSIDQPYIQQLESRNENLKFARIDAELADDFIDDEVVSQESQDALVEIFRKNLGREKLEIKVQNMKDEDVAAIITLSEEQRRMQDMMKMYGMGDDPNMFGGQETLVLNASHPLVKYVLDNRDAETVPVFCKQLYDLAMISHKPLNQTEMNEFVKRSNEIMMLLTK